MMTTFILVFAVMLLAILGMAVGVMFGGKPLREGGCGNVDGDGVCSVCGKEGEVP